jgi:hypothetical protein
MLMTISILHLVLLRTKMDNVRFYSEVTIKKIFIFFLIASFFGLILLSFFTVTIVAQFLYIGIIMVINVQENLVLTGNVFSAVSAFPWFIELVKKYDLKVTVIRHTNTGIRS